MATYVSFNSEGDNYSSRPTSDRLAYEVVNILGSEAQFTKWGSKYGPYGTFEITSYVSPDDQERLRIIPGVSGVSDTWEAKYNSVQY